MHRINDGTIYTSTSTTSGDRVTILLAGASLFSIFAALLVLLMVPTVLWVVSSGVDSFFAKPFYRLNSPDNKYQITVTRRRDFPVLDLLDPTATVGVELRDTTTSKVIDQTQYGIRDLCDLQRPELEWTTDKVKVKNIGTRTERAFSLALTEP